MTSFLQTLSHQVGVQEASLTFVIAILISYLISLLYAFKILNKSNRAKTLYFLLTGFSLITWAYGINVIHSLVNCLFCYCTLRWISISRWAIAINMIFTMAYLLYGYILNQVDWNYSLTWTMPQCILTLRLIAFSFDLLDGSNQILESKKEKKEVVPSSRHISTAIVNGCPNFLDYLSYCYFPATLFVGPLIPYVSYEKFLKSTDYDSTNFKTSLYRLSGSFLISGIFLIGSMYWPVEYLLNDEFHTFSLWWKLTAIAIVTKIYMYKYILCWLIAESACIVSGITQMSQLGLYSHNIHYIAFETSTSFTSIIKSYNISTNNFAFKYIYRRLKFLGNVYISQTITLAFLSIWHGFESGYHSAFFIEFLLLYFEKNSEKTRIQIQSNMKYSSSISWIIGKLYSFYFLGYGFLPFMFLYYELWFPIFRSVYFVGHVLLGTYLLINIVSKYI